MICICSVHSDQCLQPSENHFLDVAVDVEPKEQPKVAAGSWQELSGWRTSDSSWSEGVWNKKWDTLEEEKTELVRTECSEWEIDPVFAGVRELKMKKQ